MHDGVSSNLASGAGHRMAARANGGMGFPTSRRGHQQRRSSLTVLGLGLLCLRGAAAQTGDKFCNPYFCITGILNGTTTTYEVLASQPASSIGWMGMGFGTQMTNSSLIVLWPNSDGTVTLSQRMAKDYVMPTVVPNPPRVATLSSALTSLGTTQTKISFTIPSEPSPSQNILWSISTQRPSSSAIDAIIVQHVDQGTTTFDLSKPLPSSSSATASSTADGTATRTARVSQTASPTPAASTPFIIPLSALDKNIIIHATLCAIGFAVLPPLGALWARYARTFVQRWFVVHWILNFWIALPIAVAGWGYGVHLVQTTTGEHFNTTHTKAALALLVLAVTQWSLGFVVHFAHPAQGWARRPPQNYFHALLGLTTIALAFFTVYAGFTFQWPLITARTAPGGITILWAVWVAVVGFAYFAGTAFLPRQYRQEEERRKAKEAE